MKRAGYIFDQVIAFDNLLRATQQAARGKKQQLRVAHFLFHLEKELLHLQQQLKQNSWQPSNFRVFEIQDPKPRRISSADFQDRVVHHALCNILEPIFDKRLIYDTWACRKGKGTHQAVHRAQTFSTRNRYFIKCDIRRYFDNIDHIVLKQILQRIIKDKRVITLLERIIDHPLPNSLPHKGLPIGNLTSQYFANLYLGKLDHELKDKLGIKWYLRYMDDMLVFTENKAQCHRILSEIENFIKHELHLNLKPSATQISPVSEGIPFLGFRIFPNLIRLNPQSLQRFRKRVRKQEQAYQRGEIDVETLTASVQSMTAHMRHANTHRLRQSLLTTSYAIG